MNLHPDPILAADFGALVGADASEWFAATLVNRVVYPDLDAPFVRARVTQLQPPPLSTPWDYLRDAGFQGDARALVDLDNSCIDRVLERRRGLPITLAVVLIEVARAQGREAWGLNTPGHFLARVDGQVIDPVRMSALAIEGEMPRANAVDIALRMLNNIKHACMQQAQPHSALTVIEYQRSVAAAMDDPRLLSALYLESGTCWQALQMPELARDAWEHCVDLAEEGSQIAAQASAGLRLLGRTPPPTFH